MAGQYSQKPIKKCNNALSLAELVMESGASSEIAIVGNEGVLGICMFMGGKRKLSQAVVKVLA